MIRTTIDAEELDTSDPLASRRTELEQLFEFEAYFQRGNISTRGVTRGWTGGLKTSTIRSLYWKVMLRYLPLPGCSFNNTKEWFEPACSPLHKDVTGAGVQSGKAPSSEGSSNDETILKWLEHLRKHRASYQVLKDRLFVDPHKDTESDVEVNNPLSDAAESPWQQYFRKSNTERIVKQDVTRLDFDLEFFNNPFIRDVMIRVLTIWAMEHERVGYRQGMHELLAPFIILVTRDARQRYVEDTQLQRIGQAEDMPETRKAALAFLQELLDFGHMEADCYYMFDQLMTAANMQEWYYVVEQPMSPLPRRGEETVIQADAEAAKRKKQNDDNTPILLECSRIQNTLLKQQDPYLHRHLTDTGIQPQLYALRWLRLLFLREFPFEAALALWDALLADLFINESIDNFPPYVATAMLIHIRDDLIGGDSSICLHRLMKFPPVPEVHSFIQKAVEMRYHSDKDMQAVVNPPKPVPKAGPPPSVIARTPASPAVPAGAKATPAAPAAVQATTPTSSGEKSPEAKQRALGQRLAAQLEKLNAKWFPADPPAGLTDEEKAEYEQKQLEEYVLAIAELKRIRDILLGEVPEDM
eukprot:TRINITY_DN3918_c0_g1_i1.p1 TRINITY_DN3918_c0_g1~~TRINITY_DN3918_c0_g1_i1.p1  ORF type:complete len:584 (-),score=111.89 TRINITY_DN3918_c0_g1_i1:1568-3319(-)